MDYSARDGMHLCPLTNERARANTHTLTGIKLFEQLLDHLWGRLIKQPRLLERLHRPLQGYPRVVGLTKVQVFVSFEKLLLRGKQHTHLVCSQPLVPCNGRDRVQAVAVEEALEKFALIPDCVYVITWAQTGSQGRRHATAQTKESTVGEMRTPTHIRKSKERRYS